jgi:PAS domain S-box-containing protein
MAPIPTTFQLGTGEETAPPPAVREPSGAFLPVVLYTAQFCRPNRSLAAAGDLEAEITQISAAAEALIGCPPGELLGPYDRWLARVHADDREVLGAAMAQMGRHGQSVTCEYRLAQDRGTESAKTSIRWLRDTLAPQLDAEGRLIGWEGVLIDISEQRALADDLRRTTSMLNALVDNLPAGVFFVQGPRGHPILVNARARQLLGQREDLSASLEHLSEVYRLHRPDGTSYPIEELPVYLALRQGLTAMRDDIVVHRPDGRRAPLVTWAAPVTLGSPDRLDAAAAASAPEAAVWVMEDLTALHQAEAARRDTETRLRTILETMSEGVVVRDRNGCVIDCNPAACVILGQTPEKLLGTTLAECAYNLMREDGTLIAGEDHPAAIALRTGRPVRNQVLAVVPHCPQGQNGDRRDAGPTLSFKEPRWMLANAMPLGAGCSGEQRGALGVVSTIIDITTTIRAQRMLRVSEEKYRDLVESLPLMVLQADTNLRITYANPATRSMTGYDLDEIAEPALWSRLVHPDDVSRLVALAHEALAGRSGRAEYRYRAKDGSDKVGLAFFEPRRRPDGAIIGTTTLIADVTRERQLEQELLRAQRLELIGKLSSGIAHDFNNLLSVVLSMTEMASAALPSNHAAQVEMGRIKEATKQAANLTSQLLAFGKPSKSADSRIDINPIVARTLELLRATLPSRIVLRTELAKQELLVQADPTQVQQVLMNLCLNARDAMPNGGLLQVRTAPVSAEGEWVCLSVCDQGTGISEAAKAHLFDPFFSTKERGTGLGLAVVQHIVKSYGGRIEVSSEPGEGARFDVWWPAAI